MIREELDAALFARLAAIPGVVTASRRLRHWNDVATEMQPALFYVSREEAPHTVTGQPACWRLRRDVYLYVRVADDEAPACVMNPLLDAVCAAINEQHPVSGRTTLPVDGAFYVRVEGTIQTDEGCLGNQAVAIVPVEILAN